MIESEEKRQYITEEIERWCNHVKATPLLRSGDIPGLVDSIIDEFYHITLCCGHHVKSFDEGKGLAMDEGEGGTTYGDYCEDCYQRYIVYEGARAYNTDI